MEVLAIIALLFASSEALRRPIPYDVYVRFGGLPLPEALRNNFNRWYSPLDETSNITRIVGGSAAASGEFPWIVSLRTSYHFCGGSIFNERYIITAAHCLQGQNVNSVSVRYNTLNSGSGATIKATKLTIHPSYSSSTIDYDVGIIELAEPMTLGQQQAQPVALPSSGSDPAEGNKVLCAGWGTTSEGGSTSTTLLKVEVPIVSRANCRSAYGSSSITDRMICAGETSGGKDACQGDSGGPLTDNGVLVGIVSWGYGCARPNYPGVYARTASFIEWINANTA